MGQRRTLLYACGHHLGLAVRDIDDFDTGGAFDQPHDFLGREFLRMDDQIDLEIFGIQDGIAAAKIQ